MNDRHMVDDSLSLEELTQNLLSSGNDTTPTQTTAHYEESSQAMSKGSSQPETTHNQQSDNETTTAQQTQPLTHKYVFYSLGEFLQDLTPMEYLIDNWIQAEGLHQIFGESGSYKSFCAIDMCATIACSDIDTWCGKSVEHGGVVYLAGEGVKGLKIRFAGWCLEHSKNPNDIPLYITPEAFTLDDKTPEHNIDSTIANIRAQCSNPRLVVIDTLNRYMSGEENSATDMGAFILACSKLERELSCAVLIIHHSGLSQDAKGRGRGSGALRAALDIEIQCEKSGMTCTLTQKKNKESALDKPLSFNMEKIEIHGVRDKKGNLIRTTTLIPTFNEETTQGLATNDPEKPEAKKPGTNYTRGIDTFKEAAIRHGRLSINEAGESFIDIELEEWREVAYEMIDIDKKTDSAKRSAFNRARKELVEGRKPPIVTRYVNGEGIFYRLARNNEAVDATFRIETFAAVIQRIEAEKKSAKANNAGADGEAETNTTQNLF